MEIFFAVMLTLSLLCNLALYFQMNQISAILSESRIETDNYQKSTKKKLEFLVEEYAVFHTRIQMFLNKTDSLSQPPLPSSAPPIKPNNWDSVRKALAPPVREENV